MRIKTKLTFGVGLLFVMILLLVTLSSWYVYRLKKETNNILVANYNTLQYSRNMLLALEDISKDKKAVDRFQDNLDKQKENVTEIGEGEATDMVVKHFSILKTNPVDAATLSATRKDITELMKLNMDAIGRKSSIADKTAENAIIVISMSGAMCFMIAFVLLVNLPSSIANPITELTRSIQEISDQNYKERVHFEGNNDFGLLAKSFNKMAEKLEEYSGSKLDKILKGKKRIEALIDSMHDPVLGIDENMIVLFINEEALNVTGLKKEDVVGRPIQDIAVVNDLVRDIIRDAVKNGEKKNGGQPLKIFADNKESYFEKEIVDINIVPTGERSAQFIGQVIMLRNVTHFKELDLAKTNFLGTVSHEFKTPIASLQMGIQLLENEQMGSLNEEQKTLLTGLKEDTSRLLKITGELLNMTQVESGSIHINMLRSGVRPIVSYALKANKSAADRKQIKLEANIDENISDIVADSEKTAWVLTNLLSNAIRYSHENSVVAIHVSEHPGKVEFSVTDTGQGIETQYLEKIFDRYFRIPGTKREGTGLGLSISKEFIEAQGGKIAVKSEYGAGSTFSFYLRN